MRHAQASRPGVFRLRAVRLGLALGLILLLAVAGWSIAAPKPPPRATEAGPIEVAASRIVSFEPLHPGQRRFGALEFRGGLVLTSTARTFGGWSALALSRDGRQLLSISDTGVWLTGELTYDGDHPAGIANARLGPLLGLDGKPYARGRDRDSEGLAVVSGTLTAGEALISFEQNHRIGRFPISNAGVGVPVEFLTLPPETRRQRANKSLESVCQVKAGPDAGAIVTLSERYPSADGQHVGWLREPGGGWRTIAIRNLEGYDLTDCHGLSDGGFLVLERRFRWRDVLDGVRMRLRYFSAAEIAAGGLMAGEILVEAGNGREIDNMEGLAIHEGPQGETMITMISDDNFNHVLQRTVLLQFAWRRHGLSGQPQ